MKGKLNIKQKRAIIMVFLTIMMMLILIWILIPRNDIGGGLKDGYISIANDASDIEDDLFYQFSEGKVMVNLIKLDDCLDLDVIRDGNTYRISTIKNQVNVTYDSSLYELNGTKFNDDETYIVPISVNGYVYADFDKIFSLFGYDVIYQMNYDETIIEAQLTPKEGYSTEKYTQIKSNLYKEENIEETREQIEDKLEYNETESFASDIKMEQLPVVPEPTEVNQEYLETKPEYIEETETETLEVIEPTEETTGPEETVQSLEVYKENRWEENKETLTKVFQESKPNFGQEGFAQLDKNVICFNQAAGSTYGNTVTVVKDSYDGYYMLIYLSADWSDQSNNVVTPQSKQYYAGLEDVYKRTIVEVLGETEGTAFFEYLKAHADQTMQGGYISQYDENGAIRAVWTDGPVGDGLMASTLDLSGWTGRFTDDGLEYNIVRNGDGIKIIIF